MVRDGVTVRVATWSAAHPWKAIVGWLLFVVVCLLAGGLVGDHAATGADYRVGEAGRAEAMAAGGGLPVAARERILISAPRGGHLNADAALAAGRQVAGRLHALPEVSGVRDPQLSADRGTVLVEASLRGDQVAATDKVAPVLAVTAKAQKEHPELRITQTGTATIEAGNNTQRGADLALSEEITLPVTLLILLVVFGAVLAAGVPVLLALSAIAASVGLSALFSHLVPDAGVGAEIIILMGMAVGVDYSLFYLRREREERRRAGGALAHADAVRLAAATSGRAVVMSALGVVVSTACLYVAGDIIFSSLATAAIIVVLVAMISSVTVLPALLVKLGRRVDRPRVPLLGRLTARQGAEGGRLWTVLLRPATRRPVLTLIVAVLAMLGLAAPALGMTLNEPDSRNFSREIPAVVAYQQMITTFPAQTASHLIVVKAPAGDATRVRDTLTDLAGRAGRDRTVAGSLTDLEPRYQESADHTVHTLALGIPYSPTSKAAEASLKELRTVLVPATVARLPGARYAVAGDVARNTDYVAAQSETTPWVVALVLLMTFVMMLVTFRSVVLGVVAVLLNMLSAVAAFGALVLVFQHRWAEGLLGFTSLGFVSARVPLFLFVILFGLSMDYQVFVVSRIREAARRGLPTREAVREGITGSAGVITSAAVVMVSVFVSFMFLHLLEVKQTGFGLAVAVLLDAAVVRILILPALLTLLGRLTWWPANPYRRHATPANRPTVSAHG